MSYYCNICDKTMNHKSRNRHNRAKRHYFMKTYVTNIQSYNASCGAMLKKSFMRGLIVII